MLGEPLWRPTAPKGFADEDAAWIDGLAQRLDVSNQMARRVAGLVDPAVAVETGQVRWHDTMATVPLVARGARLLALASRFPGGNDAKFVFLDTESGRIVAELPTLEIPHWGPLTYLGGQGSEAWFALEGRSKGGRDFLIWRYRTQRRVQGATPPKLARPLTEREPEDSGVVEVDLAAATMHPTRETFADPTGQQLALLI